MALSCVSVLKLGSSKANLPQAIGLCCWLHFQDTASNSIIDKHGQASTAVAMQFMSVGIVKAAETTAGNVAASEPPKYKTR